MREYDRFKLGYGFLNKGDKGGEYSRYLKLMIQGYSHIDFLKVFS